MLTATCAACGKSTRVADVMAGRSITCGGCGTPVTVPGVGAATTATSPLGRRAAATSAGAGGRRLGFNVSRATISILVLGCVLCFYGGREVLLARGASETPQDITCQQLIDHGFGSNAHVRLGEMRLLPYGVHTADKATPDDWKAVYIPVVPTSVVKAHTRFFGGTDWAAIKAGGDIHVIFKTPQVKTADDFNRELTLTSVDGLIVNHRLMNVESINGVAADLLHQSYPRLDLSKCYLISEGRQLNGGLGAAGVAGGAAVILLALWLLFRPTT